jgi:hypothetical protein
MFFSDGLNEHLGNVVNVDFALMCKLSEFGVIGEIPPCRSLDVPVTLGILCDMRCSGGSNHLHGKHDCCVQVSHTRATKNRKKNRLF